MRRITSVFNTTYSSTGVIQRIPCKNKKADSKKVTTHLLYGCVCFFLIVIQGQALEAVIKFSIFTVCLQNKVQFKAAGTVKIFLLFTKSKNICLISVHCMVYLPSQSHSDSGKHKEYTKHCTKPVLTRRERKWAVLISNAMAGNRHHG